MQIVKDSEIVKYYKGKEPHEVYFKSIRIELSTAHGYIPIFEDGNYIGGGDDSRFEVLEAFEAEPFHYATVLEGGHQLHSFNTYNHGAPVVACGVYDEDYDFAIVNFHRGGDARGNYSQAYYIEGYDNVTALISQNTRLVIQLGIKDSELWKPQEWYLDCENGEAYFPFDTFDIHDSNILEEPLKAGQFREIMEKMSRLFPLIPT